MTASASGDFSCSCGEVLRKAWRAGLTVEFGPGPHWVADLQAWMYQ